MANGLSRNGKVIGPAWRMGIVRQAEVTDAAPAAWERLLGELGVAEAQAIAEVEQRTEIGRELRDFARRNLHRRYVPEKVLMALGLVREAEAGVDDRYASLRRGSGCRLLREEAGR